MLQDDLTSTLPEFNPYEQKWDGIIPIENDPLTRLRVLVRQLKESMTLGGNLVELDPFLPLDG